jgi:hypothetical protein
MDKRTSFLQIPNVFFETCALPDAAQILFLRLAAYLGKHHQTQFTGSIRQLANAVRMSKSSVDRMSKRLGEAKLATITHDLGTETSRQVMNIELAMDALWNLNIYHHMVTPVPVWDKELPDCPNVGQLVPAEGRSIPDRDSLSQQRDVLSQPQAQTQDNTFKTDKTTSIQKKEETPTTELSISQFSEEESQFLSWLKEAGIPWKEKDTEATKQQIAFVRDRISTKEMLHKYCDHARTHYSNTVWLANLAKQWLLDDFLKAEQAMQPFNAPAPLEMASQSDIESLAAEILREYPEIVLVVKSDEYGPCIEMPNGEPFADGVRDAEDWRILRSDTHRLAQVLAYGRQRVMVA